MSSLRTRPLVTTSWLYKQLAAETSQRQHKGTPHITILDVTCGPNRDPTSFVSKHIPTAQFLDQNRCIITTGETGAGALPEPECFSAYTQALGVSKSRQIVVYDRGGMAAAARAWWTFRVLGHGRVSVLDGGLTRWAAEHRPTMSNHVKALPVPGDFTCRAPRPDLVRHLEDMRSTAEEGSEGEQQVVDARSPRAFWGEDPEPSRATSAALRARGVPVPTSMWRGHMPGAHNLPAGHLLAHDGRLRAPDELQAGFRAAGVDLTRPLVAMCYNGDLACLVALAAAVCGNTETAVYLGSWTEWGQCAHPHHVSSGRDQVFHQAAV